MRGFFPAGWDAISRDDKDSLYKLFLDEARLSVHAFGHYEEAFEIGSLHLQFLLRDDRLPFQLFFLASSIANLMFTMEHLNRLAKAMRLSILSSEILDVLKGVKSYQALQPFILATDFVVKLDHFYSESLIGNWEEAASLWSLLDPMGRDWPRNFYRPGSAEYLYACHHFEQGTLQECHLAEAERLAVTGKNRPVIRALHRLRGEWRLDQGAWALAAASYQEAVRLARERSLTDAVSETGLALARLQLRLAADPGAVEPLAAARWPSATASRPSTRPSPPTAGPGPMANPMCAATTSARPRNCSSS
jgi:hypothetical protein